MLLSVKQPDLGHFYKVSHDSWDKARPNTNREGIVDGGERVRSKGSLQPIVERHGF